MIEGLLKLLRLILRGFWEDTFLVGVAIVVAAVIGMLYISLLSKELGVIWFLSCGATLFFVVGGLKH